MCIIHLFSVLPCFFSVYIYLVHLELNHCNPLSIQSVGTCATEIHHHYRHIIIIIIAFMCERFFSNIFTSRSSAGGGVRGSFFLSFFFLTYMKRDYFMGLLSRYKTLSLWIFVGAFLIPMERLYIIESSVLAGTDYWYRVFMLKNTLWQRKYPISAASCVCFVCMFRECVCVCVYMCVFCSISVLFLLFELFCTSCK